MAQRQSTFLWCFLFACIADGFIAHAFSLSMVERGTVVVAGATGYIGKSTVRESVRQGYKTVALVRNLNKVESVEGQRLYQEFFKDAEVIECDVSDPKQLQKVRKKVVCHFLTVDSHFASLNNRVALFHRMYVMTDYETNSI